MSGRSDLVFQRGLALQDGLSEVHPAPPKVLTGYVYEAGSLHCIFHL